jgi:hypothetical protein
LQACPLPSQQACPLPWEGKGNELWILPYVRVKENKNKKNL